MSTTSSMVCWMRCSDPSGKDTDSRVTSMRSSVSRDRSSMSSRATRRWAIRPWMLSVTSLQPGPTKGRSERSRPPIPRRTSPTREPFPSRELSTRSSSSIEAAPSMLAAAPLRASSRASIGLMSAGRLGGSPSVLGQLVHDHPCGHRGVEALDTSGHGDRDRDCRTGDDRLGQAGRFLPDQNRIAARRQLVR